MVFVGVNGIGRDFLIILLIYLEIFLILLSLQADVILAFSNLPGQSLMILLI